jgi:hypothetical protein
MERLTRAKVNIFRRASLTDSLAMLENNELIEIGYASVPSLELEFDHYRQSKTLSLHAVGIPVQISY